MVLIRLLIVATLITPIRNVDVVADSANPTVPVTDHGILSAPLLASTAAQCLALSDRCVSVKTWDSNAAWNATGDGVTDDYAAIQTCLTEIAAAGNSGAIYFPPGIYRYSQPLVLPDFITIVGAGRGRTFLNYCGPGDAISIPAFEGVHLQGIKLVRTANATNGIVLRYHGSTTGWKHRLLGLQVVGFPGNGIAYLNCEQVLTDDCYVYGCGVGFYADNSEHTGGAHGISNIFRHNRAHYCTSYGWNIGWQTAASFEGCQGLRSSGAAQFFLRGTSNGCRVTALDVEVADDQRGTGIGLMAAGNKHRLSVNAVNLQVGIKGTFLSNSTLEESTYSHNTTDLLLDASTDHVDYDFAATDIVSDLGTNNKPL